jgi:thioredoxin 1
MSNSLIQETTDTNFEFEVMRSTQPVLVDCWSRGCRPCEQMLPWLDEAAASYDGRLKIVRMNVDDSHRVAAKLGVRALPTLMLFDRGEMRGLSVPWRYRAKVAPSRRKSEARMQIAMTGTS